MVATREAGLEIVQDGVDPFELGHVPWLAHGHNRGMLGATGCSDGTNAGKGIGEHSASRRDCFFALAETASLVNPAMGVKLTRN